MAKNNLIIILIVILVIVGIIFILLLFPQMSGQNVSQNSNIKVFKIGGVNFKFTMNGQDNPDVIVNEGDKVKIEFISNQGFHDWVVDEFNARTSQVNANGTTSVEFTADKKGTFEYYCSVGQHRTNGMKGNLIVR